MRQLPLPAAGLQPDTIGATLVRDGARLAAALGLPFAEGYREAQGFLAHVATLSRAQVTARHRDAFDGGVRAAYEDLIARRSHGEPYAYLVGRREFHGLDFLVTPAVLIPRPETELLVEVVLGWLGLQQEVKILDLGTGAAPWQSQSRACGPVRRSPRSTPAPPPWPWPGTMQPDSGRHVSSF